MRQSSRDGLAPQGALAANPVTLQFADQTYENAYLLQQSKDHAANELWLLNVHIVAGLLHLATAAYTTSGGNLFSWFSAWVIVPYTSVAIAQRLAATTAFYQRHRTACCLGFEALFIALCANGLPTWVLVEATDLRAYTRDLFLGSAFLVVYWFTFWSQKPFIVDLFAIPVQFGVLAAAMNGPTCQRLEGTEFARATSRSLSASLDVLASSALPSCPTHSCVNIMMTWEALAYAALIYMRYSIELQRRARFADPMRLDAKWPALPPHYLGVLHVALAWQLLAVLWVVLQCSQM